MESRVERIEAWRWAAGAPRVRWGAIFAGTFVALGIWALLYAFGLAVGLSAVDPSEPGTLRGAGIGTGVWSLVAPLIALFFGGMVASRSAGTVEKADGAVHGAVLWSLTTIAGAFVLLWAVSSVIGTAARLGGQAVTGVASGAATVAGAAGERAGSAIEALGLDTGDLLAPVNERLRAEGKPIVTTQQLEAAARTYAQQAVRGEADREALIGSIASQTNLSRADAEDLAGRVERLVEERKQALAGRFEDVKEGAAAGAARAADVTGKAFWGVFAALALGLVSAILGSFVGVSKRQRYLAEELGTAARVPA